MSDIRPNTDGPKSGASIRVATCPSIRSRLGEALDQRLGRPDAKLVREHLLACTACRAEHDMLARLQRATQALPDQRVSDDFRERLLARIEAGEGTRPELLEHPMSLAGRVKLFTSGALTAAALLVAAWLVYDGLRQPEQVMPRELAALASPSLDFQRTVDANGIGLRAVRKPQELFDDLRAQASRLSTQPPKRAIEQVVEQSQNVIQSIRFVNALDGTLFELPQEVRAEYRSAERVAFDIVREAQQSEDSRTSVNRIIELLERVPDRKLTISVTLRLSSTGSIDIGTVLQSRVKNMDELRDQLHFLTEHLLSGEALTPTPTELWGFPTLQIRTR
ncbi:MAG TPA: zf-HC2 domain-containing protein [Planctomycetota bacterium]|nr:zf-HC2 domain-containing protein [Planctomycetota bacterium]